MLPQRDISVVRCTSRNVERAWCEPLEGRVLMAGTPPPAIGDLENPNDAVLRIETPLGTIDIDLVPTGEAPTTFNRFLVDLRAGSIDQTVFHRSLAGQLLQMGAVRYGDAAGPGASLAESPMTARFPQPATLPVPDPQRVYRLDPASRPELQWTVSLSEVFFTIPYPPPFSLSDIASSTSLTFNLTDHPVEPLDTLNPGVIFTERRVIGRVLPGASRAVVTAIAALPTVDSSGYTLPAVPFGFILGNFPTLHAITVAPTEAPPVSEALEVTDIELIKPEGALGFYGDTLYYPGGWSSKQIDERVLINNPGDTPVNFQLIVRYERGWRDTVISTATLGPHEFTSNQTSELTQGSASVREGEPYAFEIHATGPLAATLYHRDDFFRYDSGRPEGLVSTATGAEAFFSPAGYRDDDLKVWQISSVATAGDTAAIGYLLWQNMSDQPAHLQLTVYPRGHDPYGFTVTVPARRRGGFEAGLSLDPFFYGQPAGVRIESDRPIAAAFTVYANNGGPYDQTTMVLGRVGGASSRGAAPGRLKSFNNNSMNIVNPGSSDATVTMFVQRDADATPKSLAFDVPAERTILVNVGNDILSVLYPGVFNGNYSLWYESTAPVTMNYWSEGQGTEFAARAATVVNFADGSVGDGTDVSVGGLDPGAMKTAEEISVFNSFASQDVTFSLTYHFLDGSAITTPVMTAGSHRRTVAQTGAFTDVLDKVRALGIHTGYWYAITLNASAPVVAQLCASGPKDGTGLRFGEISHLGNPAGTIVGLDDPMFD